MPWHVTEIEKKNNNLFLDDFQLLPRKTQCWVDNGSVNKSFHKGKDTASVVANYKRHWRDNESSVLDNQLPDIVDSKVQSAVLSIKKIFMSKIGIYAMNTTHFICIYK